MRKFLLSRFGVPLIVGVSAAAFFTSLVSDYVNHGMTYSKLGACAAFSLAALISSPLQSYAQLSRQEATVLDFTPSDPSLLFPNIHGRHTVEESDARFRAWISPNLDWATVMVDNFPHLLYYLSFKTGDGSALEVGRTYSHATGVFGGTPGTPGLAFSGGEGLNLGNNSVTGKFKILDLKVSDTRNEFDQPEVLSFAADFTQFDDMGSLPGPPSFTVGSFRFHSSVPIGGEFTPVPEPSTYGVAVASLLGALVVRRRRRA